jgi:hypothetical protein
MTFSPDLEYGAIEKIYYISSENFLKMYLRQAKETITTVAKP